MMTLTDHEQLLKRFSEVAQQMYYYNEVKAQHEQLIDYIRDGNVLPPASHNGLYRSNVKEAYWNILRPEPARWNDVDDRLLTFAFSQTARQSLEESFYDTWLTNQVGKLLPSETIAIIVKKLNQYGVSEADFWLSVLNYVQLRHLLDSDLGQWVVERVEQYHAASLSALHYDMMPYLQLLLNRKPQFVKAYVGDFLQLSNYNGALGLDAKIVKALLANDAAYFEPYVVDTKRQVTDPHTYRDLQLLLSQRFPERYPARSLTAAYDFLEVMRHTIMAATSLSMRNVYVTEREQVGGHHLLTAEVMFNSILDQEEPTKAREYLYNWLKDAPGPHHNLFELLSKRLGADSVPFLILGLQTDLRDAYFDVVGLGKALLKLLSQYDYSAYYSQIWALTRHKSKPMRELTAVTLAKLGDAAIPEADKLLNDKKADARQTGALILSLIKTDQALNLLKAAVDNERNDDARDLILDSLAGLLPVPTTEAEALVVVEKARLRGKLDAPLTPWLSESAFPTLYWQASGQALSSDAVRFLFYRMSRAKDIRPDAEAKSLLALIDRDRSKSFAKALLKAYVDNGADPKFKGYLTLGAMLGGDDEVDFLRAKVNQWVDANRSKMAEYAVQALALIGSNKALRAVELFSRKYKNKNKNVGAAANEAFRIAAETLGITPYELADAVIPNFGFTGLFREFVVKGETYRAFIDNDFKLAFLNDDNRVIKSLPKATPTALKDEFKEIGKEIRDIVKSQSSRLEQYLVIQRKWPAEKWQDFFMGNPVMFAYAVRLIWGVYDDQQRLLFTFRCQEDQTLVNAEGDEVALDDNYLIGMVHPLSLTADQIVYWNEQLADADVEPIFPQLNRRLVALPDDQRSLRIDKQFQGVEMGGYGFVSKMEKLGWVRGSVQDAGSIASYYKDFSELSITAVVTQEGDLGIGYYDGNAALGKVIFARNGSVRFGSYVYDEPSKEDDPRLIQFGDVPPIVYSEVMADLQSFKS